MNVTDEMYPLDIVKNWYAELAPETVVQFQPGHGFMSQILRPRHHGYWYGVETWTPYVERYNHWDYYDKIIVSDIRHLDFNSIYALPDLVILCDVIPHMAADEAVVVLNQVKVWTDNILLSVPTEPVNHETGNWTYGHQSHPTLASIHELLGPGVEKVVAGDGEMYFLWKAT